MKESVGHDQSSLGGCEKTCGAPGIAEQLNRGCYCQTLNPDQLQRELTAHGDNADLYRDILATRPHLFSNTAVFVSPRQIESIKTLVAAVEAVAAVPAYQEHVLSWSPGIARFEPGPAGAFMGFDVHLDDKGPQLIEVNTNAGGAFLNAALLRAQTACCRQGEPSLPVSQEHLEQEFMRMFQVEWSLQRGSLPLRSIAILDDKPHDQYLYPEFELARRVFQERGLEALIVDPEELEAREGAVWARGRKIDLVYNRLTDFSLQNASHQVLRNAYLNDQVVLTPHPRTHAIYADKRNLTVLSDSELLRSWGIGEDLVAALSAAIPRTVSVTEANRDDLWQRRKDLFFKPASGFGSKATYRGDKLTKRVWEEILQADYVAQERVAPSERAMRVDQQATALKVDIRAYTYQGQVQLLAARLYQGQTTNFRTPGGGFAAVFVAG